MKVLYLISENPKSSPNPYIYSLIKAMEEQKLDFSWGYGVDLIWDDECLDYDIIHIHWPHFLKGSLASKKKTLDDICNRIEVIKDNGVKIITTCHNLEPHYSKDEISHSLYNIIYSYSDYIIHLGEYSYNLLKERYHGAKHVIIPHHIYDNIYENDTYSKEYCYKSLKLKCNKKYVLCFGSFRHDDERNYIISIAEKLRKYNIEILAPSFCNLRFRRNLLLLSIRFLKYLYYKTFHSNIHCEMKFISDDKLPIYYGACDVAFIHRLRILNSGNLPMAFLMKKVVVGPDIGNVGCLLKETGNPVFDVDDNQAIINSILEGIELSENNKGIENYNYSKENYCSRLISAKLYKLYSESLLKEENGK